MQSLIIALHQAICNTGNEVEGHAKIHLFLVDRGRWFAENLVDLFEIAVEHIAIVERQWN